MMKKICALSLITFSIFANPFMDMGSDQKIAVQNAILAKVNGKTISMMDVKKKMDLFFYQQYPELMNSPQARYQFYTTSWKTTLMNLIDNELMIADALDREIQLSDGEVREEMEERFGPHVIRTLDKLELTYDETWKMVKDEMIVQRMQWFFIQKKAMSSVTPQDIRKAYREYVKKNPPQTEWSYKVLSIRTQEDEALAQTIYEKLQQASTETITPPENLLETIKEFESEKTTITLSSLFQAPTENLSEVHKASLVSLNKGEYSPPAFQISRADKKGVYRIFYLIDKKESTPPPFEIMSNRLKNELLEKSTTEYSQQYISKLRKHYGFEPDQSIPDDLHPFSLQ